MAKIHSFSAYRYAPCAGPLDKLVTQPYDKISPSMQARYLSLSPYNLVRIILGERFSEDSQVDNAYTRAHRYFEVWCEAGVLARDSEPSVYAYTQKFSSPDGSGTLTRKGFIALGDVENYDACVVHRHEQTLAGPKKDRLELLRHTHAHFGQIFMLYPDPDLAIDRVLDEACVDAPTASVTDEYDTTHRLWRLSSPTLVNQIQEIMRDKKLLIADGHHRYETALAFRNENPDLPGARQVMMTLVNMHSPGLRILATHRVVSNLPSFDAAALIERTGARPLDSVSSLKGLFSTPASGRIRIGIALRNGAIYAIDRARAAGELDVQVLHRDILGSVLNIDEEAVRNESYLQYVRGIDAAVEKLAAANSQVAFLLEPTTVEQVADVAFSGGVMPQKSTDFYPKLLSGLTIYKF